MLIITTVSCTPHTVYKTRTEYVYPPKGLIAECEVKRVKDGATTEHELLQLISEAYIGTLENISSCNIKTREAIKYMNEYETKNNKQ